VYNEDFFLNAKLDKGHIFIICDGLGGHNAGEVASQIAAETVVDYFKFSCTEDIQSSLNISLVLAQQNILKEVRKKTCLNGMGTTIVVVIAKKDEFFVGHVGDSRIYAVINDTIQCLTNDHSLIQQLIDSGELSEEKAHLHPLRNVITHALGTSFDSKKNYFDGVLSLPKNSFLLLCSDGLNRMINNNEILSSFSLKEPCKIANDLVNKAIKKGGLDNVTVSVVRVDESNFSHFKFRLNKELKEKKSLINRLKTFLNINYE
jgi:protein phosphatase